MNQDIFEKYLKTRNLSNKERENVWSSVYTKTFEQKNTQYKYNLLLNYKNMLQIAVAVIIIITSSFGVVQAADKSKPGDFLFPLDRAIENLQIKISPEEKKDELKIKFALERVEEIAEIIDETTDKTETPAPNNSQFSGTNATSTPSTTPSSSKSTDVIDTAIQTAIEYIEDVKKEMEDKNNNKAVDILDSIILTLSEGTDSIHSLELEIEKDKKENKIKLEIKNSSGRKIKIESENGKLELKSEGKFEIKHEDDDLDDVFEDLNISNSTSTPTSTPTTIYKVEVKIYQDSSKIELKSNKGELKIKLQTTDIDEIKKYIEEKYSIINLEDILKIEHEIDSKHDDDDDEKKDKNDEDEYEFYSPTPTNNSTSTATSTSQTTNQNNVSVKKIKAEIKDNYTKVELKTYNNEYEFAIPVTDENGIIQYISDNYNILKTDVEATIKFKYDDKKEDDDESKDEEKD